MSMDRLYAMGWLLLVAMSEPALSGVSPGIRAVTQPRGDVTLSFVQPGRITEVRVKEGDVVEEGQVLICQDDAAEQIQLAQLRAQSENTVEILASEASLAQKRVDLEKLEKAAARNAATALEVQHARLAVRIAELSLELARFEHEQATRRYEEQKVRVANMQLKSPLNGRVERVDVEKGESVNALTDVIRVVQIDPLWVDVPVPLQEAIGLKVGLVGRIQFLGSADRAMVAEGQVIFVGSVADAASGTLRVRIEVANKAGRPAGEHVLVAF